MDIVGPVTGQFGAHGFEKQEGLLGLWLPVTARSVENWVTESGCSGACF